MQILLIIIKSKSIKSIIYCKNFLNFLLEKNIKSYVKKQKLQKFNKIKISILKSPHIYKSAQEQFEQKIYKQKFLFILLNQTKIKFILILKKLFDYSFYDINFKISYSLLKFNLNNLLKFLNLNNFYLSFNKKYSNNFFNIKNSFYIHYYYFKNFKIYTFLKLLNLIGIILKITCYNQNSSIGRTLKSYLKS